MSSASGEALEILERLASNHGFKLSTMGFDRACRSAHLRGAATDLGLDHIELVDAHERLGRNRRIATYMDLVESSPQMAPAKSQCHRTVCTVGMRQLVIGGIAVDLQHAAEACEQGKRMLLAAPRCISVGNRRRLRAAPGA